MALGSSGKVTVGKHAKPVQEVLMSSQELADSFDQQWEESKARSEEKGDPSLSPTFLQEDRRNEQQ